MRRILIGFSAIFLMGFQPESLGSAYLSCIGEKGVVISAHRGGPAPGYPENAISTFQNSISLSPMVLETDVAASRDGVLFLMHDRQLDRTTTGTGIVAETDWENIAPLNLVDDDGAIVDERVPTLRAALDWSRDRALLLLDRKNARIEDIASEVIAAGVDDQVAIITRGLDDALLVQTLLPMAILSVSVRTQGQLDALIASGLNMDHVMVWVGAGPDNDALYTALSEAGLEINIRAHGRGNADEEMLQGNNAAYEPLLATGSDIISTDYVGRALALLGDAVIKAGECPQP